MGNSKHFQSLLKELVRGRKEADKAKEIKNERVNHEQHDSI